MVAAAVLGAGVGALEAITARLFFARKRMLR
jgi:hypothetical protein